MPSAPLPLVESLCHALEREGVTYCHWKSNEAIDRSASGVNDLDLLVDRCSGAAFAEILHHLGFKPAHLPADRRLPGVNDWYGLDPAGHRLVHVHAHYQLILGDDMTKNVHLPIERAYLDSATKDDLFRLPAPEMELLVFVVRMMLKHAPLDATLMGLGELGASEQRELAWLEARVDETVLAELVRRHLPTVPAELFARCRHAIAGHGSALERAGLALRLDAALRQHTGTGPVVDSVRKVVRRIRRAAARKVLGRRTKKHLEAGGVLIAVVGGDGSGKSTVVSTLLTGIGHDLAVRRFHLGKPGRSVPSHAVRSVLRAARLVGLFRSTRLPASATGAGAVYPGHAWAVWHVLNAEDRLRTYRRARRFATAGGIAVCDRYPLDLLGMDGARLSAVPTMRGAGPWARRLSERESDRYRRIAPPDVLIVLRVEPDRAADRRPDQARDFVISRNAEVFGADWDSVSCFVVDADRPLEGVLLEVRRAVWESL